MGVAISSLLALLLLGCAQEGRRTPWREASTGSSVCVYERCTEGPRLTFDECWELLAASIVGRLALIVDGHAEIFR
jgi:hypothetical protein